MATKNKIRIIIFTLYKFWIKAGARLTRNLCELLSQKGKNRTKF